MLNKEAAVKQSTNKIRRYLTEMVDGIVQSKTACPFGIRKVCAMIFDIVQTQYSEKIVSSIHNMKILQNTRKYPIVCSSINITFDTEL